LRVAVASIDNRPMMAYHKLVEVIMDACALMAVIVKEPERELVIELTQGAVMVSPAMMPYEIANALTRMMRRGIIEKERMISAFGYFKKISIRAVENDIERALEIAWRYKAYAYDACYLELAQRLGLPLLTFDSNMIRAGKDLGIQILGGKNAGV